MNATGAGLAIGLVVGGTSVYLWGVVRRGKKKKPE